MANIGIIGGGISGLTLAFLLKGRGHEVHVFEASDKPGGAMKTTCDRKGWLAEWGPNTIIESSGRIKQLISRLELDERRVYPGKQVKKRYIIRDQHMVAVPDSLPGLIRTSLLSRQAKWNLFKEPFRRGKYHCNGPAMKNLKHQEHQHEPDTDVRISEKHPTGRYSEQHVEESLADFVRRRLGEEFLKWPVDALAGGIYAGDPEKLSVRHAFPRLALLEEQHGSLLWGQLKGGVRRPAGSDEIPRNKARVFSFDKGLQVLPDRLAEKLEGAVTCNTQIESVTRMVPGQNNSSAGWNVTFSSPELQQKSFDVLIYAGTAYGIGNIAFPPDMMPELSMLGSIPHPPVASLTLGFHRSDITHPLDGFGLLVPGVEQLPILGTLFTSSLFPGRAPGNDHVTLTTYLGGMRQPEIAEMSEDRQSGLVCDTLGTLLGVTGKPQFRHRTVWPRAIPQYHLDHQQYLDAMDRIEQNNPRFYLAGNYRTGISVGDTINAAFDLAERIHLNLAEAMQSNVT